MWIFIWINISWALHVYNHHGGHEVVLKSKKCMFFESFYCKTDHFKQVCNKIKPFLNFVFFNSLFIISTLKHLYCKLWILFTLILNPNFGVIWLNCPLKGFICSPKFPKLFKDYHEIANLTLGSPKNKFLFYLI